MNDLDLCLEVVSMSCQPLRRLRDIRRWISRKPLEIEAKFQPLIGNGLWATKWSRDRWRHVTLKGQTRDINTLIAQYLENGLIQRLRSKGPPITKWHMGYQMVTWPMTSSDPWSLKVLWGSTVGYPSDSLASCWCMICIFSAQQHIPHMLSALYAIARPSVRLSVRHTGGSYKNGVGSWNFHHTVGPF